MSRWIWVVCVFSAISGLLADIDETEIAYRPSGLEWSRLGDKGDDDHSGNNTLFTLQESEEGSQGVTHGYDTRRGQYPYMVTVMIYYYFFYYHICGGVIYDRHTVLTAAHCLRYIEYYKYYVGVGYYDLRASNPGSQIIYVSGHTIHNQYGRYGHGVPNNIALLHLDCRIKYNTYVKPAPLTTKYDGRFNNYYCYMVGYGRTEWGYPRILQHAYVYAITNYKCKLFWAVASQARILESHICVYRYPVSSCYGDAGGPIVCRGKVAGLISWGRSFCNGCFPTVCSRISAYNKWIKKMALPE